MENKEMSLKKVKDLSYAGVLKLSKYRINEVLWEGHTAWLVFEVDKNAENILTKFINGELFGNIREYDDAIKSCKQLIFSNK